MNKQEKIKQLKAEFAEYSHLIEVTSYGALGFTIPNDSKLLEEILHKLNNIPYLKYYYISHEVGYYDSIDACVMEFSVI